MQGYGLEGDCREVVRDELLERGEGGRGEVVRGVGPVGAREGDVGEVLSQLGWGVCSHRECLCAPFC